MELKSEITEQGTLIEVIDNDDKILLNSPNGLWYKILHFFPWEEYKQFAVEYYNCLYDFNKKAEEKSEAKQQESSTIIESKEEAKERLLFERITMQSSPPEEDILFNKEPTESQYETISSDKVSPGEVPIRSAGKKPKCFFSLFKSFIGAVLMGFPAEPDKVHLLLQSNPAFMRVCEFAPKFVDDVYCYLHVPSLRKLEQFDQIMSEYGIWDKIKVKEVAANLKTGVIKIEEKLVGDTTHYHAYSSFETAIYNDEKGNEKRKSQSKTVKKCKCAEKKTANMNGI
jgi:hypothetical protein